MKDYHYKQVHGLHLLKVRGSTAYRARIHGRVLRDQIIAGAIPKLGEINEWILKRAEGPVDWPLVRPALLYFYNQVLMPKLEASVARTAPEQMEAIKALAEETGLPKNLVRNALFQADGIMMLSRFSVMKFMMKDLPPACFPGCSSAVAYGPYTEDGRLIQARNQDYPIVGRWEPSPLVFFQEPTEINEIPYISITSAGVQSGGLTSINREGITLCTHAHFGTEITTDGLPIMILGEKIISRARTIKDAVEIAKNYQRNANWSFVISSPKEKRAVVLEMTPTKVIVREALDEGRITHTNYFQCSELHKQEAIISASTLEDLFGRRLRMDQILENNRGKLKVQDMMGILGDHTDYFSGQNRIFGNTVSVVTTVKSAVFDFLRGKLYVSNRHRSPVGLGPYVEINMDEWWERDWDKIQTPQIHHSTVDRPEHFEATLHHYREAYRHYHIESNRSDYKQQTEKHLHQAYNLNTQDSHLGLLWGLWLFKSERFNESEIVLEKVLGQGLTAHLKGVAKLFKARIFDLKGLREEAIGIYRATLETIHEPGLKHALKNGIKRPYNLSMLCELMLDLQFAAPHHY